MTEQHPITPPLELVHQWTSFACEEEDGESWNSIATQAAQWGADQELEACVQLANETLQDGNSLRAARRPKPLSLKEQALLAIDTAVADYRLSADVASVVRRALEALDD